MDNQPDIKINNFNYRTCMGKASGQLVVQLPFLSKEEQKEMDLIGYTGKNSSGVRTSFEKYLNTLGKGKFSVVQTKFGSDDFIEKYMITRAWV